MSQVNIHITDQIPPENQATIDLQGQTGNTYSKTQLDGKLEENKQQMAMGIKGEALTTTTPSATGFERYIVRKAGTYTYFLDSNGVEIEVTAADLDVVNGVANNRVFLEVQDGVATKRVERVKGDKGDSVIADNKITAQSVNPVSSKSVYPLSLPLSKFINKTVGEQTKFITYKWGDALPAINGVSAVTTGILYDTNVIVPVSASGFNPIVWKNVPTKISETEYISSIKLDVVRIGGETQRVMLLGVYPDGTFNRIIPSKSSNVLESIITYNVSEYEFISIFIFNDASIPASANIGLSINKASVAGRWGLENYINSGNGKSLVSDGSINLKLSNDFALDVWTPASITIKGFDDNWLDNRIINIKLNLAESNDVTFPSNFYFPNNVAPVFEQGKTYIIVCQTYDRGFTWLASVVGSFPLSKDSLFIPNTVDYQDFGGYFLLANTTQNNIAWETNGHIVNVNSNTVSLATPATASILTTEILPFNSVTAVVKLVEGKNTNFIPLAIDPNNYLSIVILNGSTFDLVIQYRINGVLQEAILVYKTTQIGSWNEVKIKYFENKVTVFLNGEFGREITSPIDLSSAQKWGLSFDINEIGRTQSIKRISLTNE